MPGQHAGAALPDDAERALAANPTKRKHKHVRVTTQAPKGSDSSPTAEPRRAKRGENDARLRADKPPHY